MVETGHAACANILPPIKSIFTWDRKITEASEVLILFKTTSHLFDDLTEAVKQLHSYDVPEIIALPIVKGLESYLNWIMVNTRKPMK
jgi:periplasmic divalent cation tolerance protein